MARHLVYLPRLEVSVMPSEKCNQGRAITRVARFSRPHPTIAVAPSAPSYTRWPPPRGTVPASAR